MLLAARAAQDFNKLLELTINGQPHKGGYSATLTGDGLQAQPLKIENPGSETLTAIVTTLAAPLQALPAGGEGFSIERGYYNLAGEAVDVTQAKQNEQLPQVHATTQALQALVLAALNRHSGFFSAALPKKIFPPLFWMTTRRRRGSWS